jgi:hypothetical protein
MRTSIAVTAVALGLVSRCIPGYAEEPSPEAAKQFLEAAAERSLDKAAAQPFEAFMKSVYREPGPDGKFIVNGDVGILNEKQLLEFYDKNIKNRPEKPPADIPELAVMHVGGLDVVWNSINKHNISYCVSTTFGGRQAAVVAAMATATAAWQQVADVTFKHLAAQDASCNAANKSVVFDVRPTTGGAYLARAFFPNEPRQMRNVLIDASSFTLDPNDALTLAGILRHELGHTLGFRHEHTRPEAGTCFEDEDWRPLTNYDAFSVMHYPQCKGKAGWGLKLTSLDGVGAACVYGPARGFSFDPANCLKGTTPKSVTFDGQSVAEGDDVSFGPFDVVPRTRFIATMKGVGASPGDPDLYLKFDSPVTMVDYDCRPYLDGAGETCDVDIPAGTQSALIAVHGHKRGAFSLTLTYATPPPH